MRTHRYAVSVRWTGNLGQGTSDYRGYSRAHELGGEGKPPVPGSSDPAFRGDRARYSPEDLLVGSLSACHMLWYLHLSASAGFVIEEYTDHPSGTMVEAEDGTGRFTDVTLRPHVSFRTPVDIAAATALHHEAHRYCFLASSMNFPMTVEPTFA